MECEIDSNSSEASKLSFSVVIHKIGYFRMK